MIQLSNRAKSLLLVGIDDAATSIQVVTADQDLFPGLLISGDYFYAAIIDASNNVEFVKVTARVANVLTVERGVAGTTAIGFSAGSRIEVRIIDEAWRALAENDWHRPKDANGDVVMPVMVDGTSFYITGDYTNFFPQHRALKVSQTSPGFGYVTSSSYSSGTDRTTVVVDNITLDSGLSLVEAGHDVDASPRYPHAATADNATRATDSDDADALGGVAPAGYSLAGHVHDYAASDHVHVIGNVDGLADALLAKAAVDNVLALDNTTEFTPTADYHPATKKYADDHGGMWQVVDVQDVTDVSSVDFTGLDSGNFYRLVVENWDYSHYSVDNCPYLQIYAGGWKTANESYTWRTYIEDGTVYDAYVKQKTQCNGIHFVYVGDSYHGITFSSGNTDTVYGHVDILLGNGKDSSTLPIGVTTESCFHSQSLITYRGLGAFVNRALSADPTGFRFCNTSTLTSYTANKAMTAKFTLLKRVGF